ncbi:MAG: hypothetical protein AABW93_01120, partial [Nanoarchaeota archaeon]
FAYSRYKVALVPHLAAPQKNFQSRVFAVYVFVCPSLYQVYDFCWRVSGRGRDAHVQMVFVGFQFFDDPIVIGRHCSYCFLKIIVYVEVFENFSSVLGAKSYVVRYVVSTVRARAISIFHSLSIS